MPVTKYIELNINNQDVELGEINPDDVVLNYVQTEPEDWQSVQSSGAAFTLPATKLNDFIFNTYRNPNIEDLTPGQIHRNLMPFFLNVNGSNLLLQGQSLLEAATFTDKPGQYHISLIGGNGDWITDMQNITLWDCLSTTPHTFDVATIEKSWQNISGGGYDSDEDHDFVYAPVRYRAPFQYQDPSTLNQVYNAVDIYMLRPSISKYWLIIRAFRALGYSVQSQFLNTQYYRRQVMPWTWGDFFDVDSQLVQGVSFKAVGPHTPNPSPAAHTFWTGSQTDPNNTGWATGLWGIVPSSGSQYVKSVASGGSYANFRMNQALAPNGFDNFNLYSFDDATGTMQYNFNLPASIASLIGGNLTVQFEIGLIALNSTSGGDYSHVQIEITHIFASGSPTTVTLETFTELDLGSTGTFGSLLYPTIHNFYVTNVNQGDTLKFRLKSNVQSSSSSFQCNCASLLNVNPSAGTVPGWYFDTTTQSWVNSNNSGSLPVYQQQYSYITMKGILIALGGSVNFQYYDAFRNYNFLDFLGGEVDAYDLEICTDPITKTVTIEPFADATIPDYDADGNYTADITLTGYYNRTAVNDWNSKIDLNKENTQNNFYNATRQLDYSMKQDGSDGGQNIWAARYKGIYLNNVIKPKINNTIVDNGIIAGVPGASRYMFPNRFPKGNTQKQNRFFSPCMHYKEPAFAGLAGGTSPAPQFIAIYPDNISDSSASAITQVFQPKMAFYAGLKDPAAYGAWRWVGDPASPYTEPTSIEFPLPYMFGVNYNSTAGITAGGDHDPILSYSDQLVYNAAGTPVVAPGLMRLFHLPRLAIMRNGQIMHWQCRLNLNDITNFGQRNCVTIQGGLYAILSINDYKPLTDDSCEVVMYKVANILQTDIDNSFPSQDSVANSPALLSQYDLRYAQLLLFPTDIPTI